ncbi:protein borderless-like, partial [Maniola hyperantus]|uniref:protein borderless-like n=1 Tax=Aphantopus hyperantus TaxID=2795564 RepID=UPI0037497E3C
MGATRALWACWALWALCRAAPPPPDAERLRAAVGGHAVMDCHLDFPFGIEIPYQLQWDKDGEEIFSWYSGDGEPRVAERWRGRVRRVGGERDVGGGAVNVSNVRESDAGVYRCRVSFPNRTPPARNNGTFHRLDVDGGNLIVTPPSNVTVLEGARAELQCQPKSAAWSVRWLRAGAPVPTPPQRNGSLVLARAAGADAAQYECRVAAPDGRTQAAGAFLDVQFAARVLPAPPER